MKKKSIIAGLVLGLFLTINGVNSVYAEKATWVWVGRGS